jgi:hypothetical protein
MHLDDPYCLLDGSSKSSNGSLGFAGVLDVIDDLATRSSIYA